MRILLRRTKTGLFYRCHKQWTKQRDEALTFRSGGEAIQQVCSEKLEGVELFYDFGDSRYELFVPLYPSATKPNAPTEACLPAAALR